MRIAASDGFQSGANMANIYRKTALDKLSSPEQLDKTITVISPSFWIAMTGLGVILLIALLWAIFGRIPFTVSTNGIYLDQGGMRSVVSETAGFVDEVYVSDGDSVTAGQKLAHINTELIEDELSTLQGRRDSVDKVTFDSENDEGSADNKSLLDLKAQKVVADATLITNKTALESREQKLAELDAEADAARQEFESARDDYLASMEGQDVSAEQLAYQDAQSALTSSKSYYESAKSTLSQAQAQDSSLSPRKTELEEVINQLNSTNQQAQTDMQAASTAMTTAQTAQQQAQEQMAAATTDEERQAAQAAFDKATEDYQTAQSQYTEASNMMAATESQLSSSQSQLSSLQLQIDANASQMENASTSVNEWYADVSEAQSSYNAAEDAYIAAMNAATDQQGDMNQQGTLYNVALQDYTTALTAKRSQEDVVLQLMAQVASDQANLDKQNAALKLQFASTKAGILNQLDQEIKVKQKQVDHATIKSNRDGHVTGMSVAVGNAVQQGGTICRVSSEQDTNDVVICYTVVTQGRKVKKGMDVMVYPSTVSRQEYGHIKGKILEVSDYVIPAEEMVNQIGDNSLVQMFQQGGPVVRVLCQLEKDPNTASGYSWSSQKGAEVELAEGTIVSADVVTEYKAPISLVIPYLKEKILMEKDPFQDSGQVQGQGQSQSKGQNNSK